MLDHLEVLQTCRVWKENSSTYVITLEIIIFPKI